MTRIKSGQPLEYYEGALDAFNFVLDNLDNRPVNNSVRMSMVGELAMVKDNIERHKEALDALAERLEAVKP